MQPILNTGRRATANLPALASDSLPAQLAPDLAKALDYAKAEKASSTRKAYGTDFRLFSEWCQTKGAATLPALPETVAAFIAAQAGSGTRPSTLARRVAAIRYAHKLANLETPADTEGGKATFRRSRPAIGRCKGP